jgi:cyclophilin family peptidyl-prolyl cis-trans isomerase/HEAT repeat protein
VRAEAANALGQALARIPRGADEKSPLPPETETVSRTLAARIRTDPDPYVTGVAAETVGRLPYRTANAVSEAEATLSAMLPPGASSARVRVESAPLARVVHPGAITGAVKGLETLIRVYQKLQAPSSDTLDRLRGAATLGSDPSDGDFAFIRRVSWLALTAAAGAHESLIEHGLEDPDAQVRRLAVLSLGNAKDVNAERPALIARALKDRSFIVRYDAVRVYSRTLQAQDCAPVLAAVDDANAHVALAAIDALGNGCPTAAPRLRTLADALPKPNPNFEREPGTRNPEPGTTPSWHKPAHAFVSLARVAREDAAARLAQFAEHPTWQVRMYAARAAETLGAAARLERLAADAHDNVREAAIQGLAKLKQHGADAVYIDALGRPDYQLVLTAAKLLERSPNAGRAVPALVAAFTRITDERRDTSRDTRLALLERLRELGTKAQSAALHGCLSDFDPQVATTCAAILHAWTGVSPPTTPSKRTTIPVAAIAARRMRITMQQGGSFDLRLFKDDVPATIARVVRLARQGYYNGLTFHRVVPNFVLQGGSPGANEYMGDGPFMRDELGLRTHARGTLGISTRGRDTGDAQLFINLLDNPRLDHNFTVFAEVTAGMDVVDSILEGDVIDRVDVLEQAATQPRP